MTPAAGLRCGRGPRVPRWRQLVVDAPPARHRPHRVRPAHRSRTPGDELSRRSDRDFRTRSADRGAGRGGVPRRGLRRPRRRTRPRPHLAARAAAIGRPASPTRAGLGRRAARRSPGCPATGRRGPRSASWSWSVRAPPATPPAYDAAERAFGRRCGCSRTTTPAGWPAWRPSSAARHDFARRRAPGAPGAGRQPDVPRGARRAHRRAHRARPLRRGARRGAAARRRPARGRVVHPALVPGRAARRPAHRAVP